MIHFLVVSVNHHQTPVEIREKLAIPSKSLKESLIDLSNSLGVSEVIILSTCNRVEIWSVLEQDQEDLGESEILRFLCGRSGSCLEQLRPHLTIRRAADAVHHMFRVACSLDSMIVGEPQILGQVKEATSAAVEARTSGTLLGRCLERAFKVAKRVRTETRLGTLAINVSSAAVELARKIFGDLSSRTVLLLGAGEMAELAARHLLGGGAAKILIGNRSPERAEELARQIDGSARLLHELDRYLWEADIVISSTGAPTTILSADQIQRAMKRRKQQPMLVVDIAVPRDVDTEVGKLDNVFLYDIDDLERVVEANRADRAQEAEVAEKIVQAEVKSFLAWQDSLEVVPVIVSLRSNLQAIQEEEVQRALRRLGHLDAKDRQAVEALARSIVNKILHNPMTELKRSGADHSSGLDLARATRKLFGLDHEQRPPDREDAGVNHTAGSDVSTASSPSSDEKGLVGH